MKLFLATLPRVICIPVLGFALPAALAAQQPGAILLWPVNPVIEGNARAAALWLENPGEMPITLQVQIYSWSQQDGRNVYASQDEVLGSPPILSIQPGERQLVRLSRTTAPPVEPEKSYRIVVDEIPRRGEDAARGATPGAAVSFRMRYSLPLFSRSQGSRSAADAASLRKPSLSWRTGANAEGRFIEVHNGGSSHARLTQVAFVLGSQRKIITEGLFGYVLAGATMRWPLEPELDPTGALVASVNGMESTIIERLPG